MIHRAPDSARGANHVGYPATPSAHRPLRAVKSSVLLAIVVAAAMLLYEAPVGNDKTPQIRVIAFVERPPPAKPGPALLQVYIINESSARREIQNDLDSINVPRRPPDGDEIVPDAELTHIDFGTSGAGKFVPVATGECVKVTLLLADEQLALLERVRQMKAAVRFRNAGDETSEGSTALLPATVYMTIRKDDS